MISCVCVWSAGYGSMSRRQNYHPVPDKAESSVFKTDGCLVIVLPIHMEGKE